MKRNLKENATVRDKDVHDKTSETPLESTPLGLSLFDPAIAFETSAPTWGRMVWLGAFLLKRAWQTIQEGAGWPGCRCKWQGMSI